MGWRQHIPFSSASSSSSPSSSSPKRSSCPVSPDKNEATGREWYYRGLGIRPSHRLSRQKKIRYLKDLKPSSYRAPSSSSPGVSLSPSTAVPMPLPLPLPDGQRESRNHQSGRSSGHGKGVDERSKDTGRDRSGNRDRAADEAGDGVLSSSSFVSAIASGRDAKSQTTAHQDQRDGYWVDVPQSAPASPHGSPTITPHRNSTGDVFLCFNTAPKGNHVWSAPEIPLDTPGRLPPAFYDGSVSADNSPIGSPLPRSPRSQIKSPGRPCSPLHPMLSPASSSGAPPRERPSSPLHSRLYVDVHPLPLPPPAALPSWSATSPIPVKHELFPMNSQWQKGKLIGRGTFGSVYVASNRETGALCAMKEVEMFPDDPKSAESIKQLEQEIRLLSNLQHPNIVQYYGSEIVDDRFNIYLEYVHPGSIDKYIREHCGAMTESVVRSFTRHILSGLAYLHSMKTVHRDIKGANLLVDASGVVKLADFGMAKHLAGQRADLSLKGSPYWMAPELMQAVMQKDNSSDLAFAVDIWSLGCTIIEMFTGKPPWSGFEGAAAMFKVMKDTPPIPDSLSPEGKDFLRRCFKRNPAERPTAAMLRDHLFVKSSQQPSPTSPQPDISSFSQLFNGMKLTNSNGWREGSSSVPISDQLPVPPTSGSTRR